MSTRLAFCLSIDDIPTPFLQHYHSHYHSDLMAEAGKEISTGKLMRMHLYFMDSITFTLPKNIKIDIEPPRYLTTRSQKKCVTPATHSPTSYCTHGSSCTHNRTPPLTSLNQTSAYFPLSQNLGYHRN